MISSALPVDEAPAPKDEVIYLLHGDSPPSLVEAVRSTLKNQGYTVVLSNPFSDYGIPSNASIISLVDVEKINLLSSDESEFKTIQTIVTQASTLVWVAACQDAAKSEPSTMKGLLRVLANERIHAKIAFLELEENYTNHSPRAAELIIGKYQELSTSSSTASIDTDSIMRDETLHVERLLPDENLNRDFRLRNEFEDDRQELPLKSLGPVRASYSQPGLLSSLYFCRDPYFDQRLKEDWVEIKTEAIGLNMKV